MEATTTASNAPDPVDALTALEAPGPGRRLLVLLVAHLGAIAGVLALWAAADAWQQLTHLAAASILSVATAMFAGTIVTALVHEWGHYVGARIAGAAHTIPEKLGVFVFNFDYAANSARQFDRMSWGGQAAGALAVLLLWLAVPMDTAGRVMLACSGLGYAAFTAAFEWPIILRARKSGNPLQELGRVTRSGIQRDEAIGAAAALVVWLIAA